MDLIIATSNVDFANKLKKALKEEQVEVKEIATCVEDFVEALRQYPNVKGVILKTDLARKNNDPRLELLSDVVLGIRQEKAFENLAFTIISDYRVGHPLLAELFDMGIYNFYVRNDGDFSVKNLIDSFHTPMSFSVAVKYRNVSTDIPWRRNLTKNNTIAVKFEKETPSDSEATSGEDKKKFPSIKELQLPKFFKKKEIEPDSVLPADTDVSEVEVEEENKPIESASDIDEIPIQEVTPKETEWDFNKVPKVPPPIIGTVVIGVTSVVPHLGSTTAAINIAKYLTDQSYKVALVEANESLDFERIHSLSEGEIITLKEPTFELNGIKHIKYRKPLDFGSIYTNYQYVILDLGSYKDSPVKEEFNRAHIKCVVASGDEWKIHWIEEFLRLCSSQDDFHFLIPGASIENVKDLRSQLKDDLVEAFSILDSPYKVSNENEELFQGLLSTYQVSTTPKVNKKWLILTGLFTATLTASIFLLFN